MRIRQQLRQIVGHMRVRVLAGMMLVAGAVAVTFAANHNTIPAQIDILIAQHDVASGTALSDAPGVFGTVPVPADSPLLGLFVTTTTLADHTGLVLTRKLVAGEPVLLSALSDAPPHGTVLTVLLARVAALDGAVAVGDRVRVLTVDHTDATGIAVDVVAVRSVGGGLGRQEQLAVTVRVDTVLQAAQLFAAAQQNSVLMVREGALG